MMDKDIRKLKETGLSLYFVKLLEYFVFFILLLLLFATVGPFISPLEHLIRFIGFVVLFGYFRIKLSKYYVDLRGLSLKKYCSERRIQYYTKYDIPEVSDQCLKQIFGKFKYLSNTFEHVMEIEYGDCVISCGISALGYFSLDKHFRTFDDYYTFCVMKREDITPEHVYFPTTESLELPVIPRFISYEYKKAYQKIKDLEISCEISGYFFIVKAIKELKAQSRYDLIKFVHELGICYAKSTEYYKLEQEESSQKALLAAKLLEEREANENSDTNMGIEGSEQDSNDNAEEYSYSTPYDIEDDYYLTEYENSDDEGK